MAAEAPRSSSSADSYIGSLISLTSKSEIRYEGVLYNINVNSDDSSIGLKNVRSFGTEGRKKEGTQVPPSDKIYEYILFRGSDIKDLQVKSSPPVQTAPSINNDPAIIQSHYPRPASASTSPAVVGGSLTDPSSSNPQVGHPVPGSTFQGGLPLYQPGGNVGSWGPSPPPNANGNGLAMPMYWQGFYGPPNGVPHLHQQSLLRPPPGLPMAPSMQHAMQYPSLNASVPPGASNFHGLNLTEFPPSLPASASSLSLSSTTLSSSPLPPTLPPGPSATLASEVLPTLIRNKTPSSSLPPSTLSAGFPSLPPLTTSSSEVGAFAPSISSKPNVIPAPSLPYQALSQSTPPIVGTSSSNSMETPAPSLITPGQLLQSGPTPISSSQSSQTAHKDVEVVRVSSSSSAEQSVPVPKEAQPPILPLPVHIPAQAGHKLNGAPSQSRHIYRGRERGRGFGGSRPVAKFTEDFDFIAMNEKFNKDEVWGNLGKSSRSQSRDQEDGNLSDDEEFQEEDDAALPKIEVKPVYNKDDFFDTLSCNVHDREPQNGRSKFSEQMKIDTETFGDFPRHRGGYGGRGFNRGGGRSRGGYYRRGYGYAGRGRGRAMPNHAL